MKILHRYILKIHVKNFFVALATFTMLFMTFDFLDRIDNILKESASFWLIIKYFALKIPQLLIFTSPMAMLVSVIFTVGVLSKNSELTAMRSAGHRILWLLLPIYLFATVVSFVNIALNETVVPYTTRRVKEIYNIDIRKKNKAGAYSKDNFWWREGESFYSANMFDSRDSSLVGFSKFTLSEEFEIKERINAEKMTWVSDILGWSMSAVQEYEFDQTAMLRTQKFKSLPIPEIDEKPVDFYSRKTDPFTMSYIQLKDFIREQGEDGLTTSQYFADLYSKISFPFICLIICLLATPFCLNPARTGSMALSFLAGLAIGFIYYFIHSLSVALGRAEILPPFYSAWFANILLGTIGVILNLGAESPAS